MMLYSFSEWVSKNQTSLLPLCNFNERIKCTAVITDTSLPVESSCTSGIATASYFDVVALVDVATIQVFNTNSTHHPGVD